MRRSYPAEPTARPLDLVTTAQAAEIMGRSISQVNRYVRIGRLTPVVTARGHVFNRADIVTLCEELRREWARKAPAAGTGEDAA